MEEFLKNKFYNIITNAINEYFEKKGKSTYYYVEELPLTDEFITKNNHDTTCISIEYKYSYFSKMSNRHKTLRKKKRFGLFYITPENILIFYITYPRIRMYHSIIKKLKENNIAFKRVGKFIIFNYENLKLNSHIRFTDTMVLFRTKHVKIRSVFVPSNKTNRFFIFQTRYLYTENNTSGKYITYNLQELLDFNDDEIYNIIPMLASINSYFVKDIKKLEELYSEKMINALTT